MNIWIHARWIIEIGFRGSSFLIGMAQGLSWLYVISYTLFLFVTISDRLYARTGRRTSALSSGKPPSTFLSQINFGCPARNSQTRNRPPVSSVFWGIMVIDLITGVGNVSISSVETHVARCCLSVEQWFELCTRTIGCEGLTTGTVRR